MSAIILLPIIIPVAPAMWPVLASAATAAASAMGYAGVTSQVDEEIGTEVELPVDHSDEVSADLAMGEELVFQKGDIQVVFSRSVDNKISVRVCGGDMNEEELKAIGQQISQRVVQQYAYHRLMTELKNKNFNLVSEDVEEDGTVRLHVRRFE